MEPFIEHYRKKYTRNPHLPLWMGLEVISFGGLSRLLKGLKSEDLRIIAGQYYLPDKVLTSWVHTLVYARNLCAHHSRLWNRTLAVKPLLPFKLQTWRNINNNKTYCLLMMLKHLLDFINPGQLWTYKLIRLLEDNPSIVLDKMGFPADWNNGDLWGTIGALDDKKQQEHTTTRNKESLIAD